MNKQKENKKRRRTNNNRSSERRNAAYSQSDISKHEYAELQLKFAGILQH